jgi:uncharacterized protein
VAPTEDPKLERLLATLSDMGSALVCYSGGVDSALVLAAAHRALGPRAVGMTAVSPSLAPFEKEAAIAIAAQIGARHELVESHEIERSGYVENSPNRCFHCKTELYEIAEQKRAEWGLAYVLNGTNLDDLGDHRPGLAAADERGARHPMVDVGLTKADVRALSRALDLPTWDKPQLACLSSRFPYGTEITPERLHRVDGFEDGLRALGFRQLRVRYHGDVARLELEIASFPRALEQRAEIVTLGRRHGFTFVALDLAGFASGSLNQLVGLGRRPASS